MGRLIILAVSVLLLIAVAAWWYVGRGLDRYDFSGRTPRAQKDAEERNPRPSSVPTGTEHV